MSYFSKNIKFLRESKGISKSELSKRINVNQSTLTRWENGEMGATIDNALDVANYFEISMADLVGRDLSINNYSDSNLKQEILFNKSKEYLTESDWNIINAIVEQRKKEIDEELESLDG